MFGTQQIGPGTPLAYVPTKETDGTVGFNLLGSKIQINCITYMKEYAGKSLEELRYEDYMVGRKGKQAFGAFGNFYPTQTTPTPAFGQVSNQLTTTNSVFGPKPSTGLFPSLTTPSTTSVFGNTNSNNPFGGFGSIQSKPIFQFGTPTSPQPMWGSNTQFGQNPFGTPATPFNFQTPQPQFPAPAFPTPTTQSQPFTFNWPNANTAVAQQAPQTFAQYAKVEKQNQKPLFAPPAPAPTFGFGQATPTFGFGQTTPTPAFGFGQPSQTGFGQPTLQPQAFAFGQPQQPATFGQVQQPWPPVQTWVPFGQTTQPVLLPQGQWWPPGFNPGAINFSSFSQPNPPPPPSSCTSGVQFPQTSKFAATNISCTPYPELPPLDCDSKTFRRHLKTAAYDLLMGKKAASVLEMNKTPSVRSYAFNETTTINPPPSPAAPTNFSGTSSFNLRGIKSHSATSSSSPNGGIFGSLRLNRSQTDVKSKDPVLLASNFSVPTKAHLDDIRAEFDPFFTPPTAWKTLDLGAIGNSYQNDIAKRAAERAQNRFAIGDDDNNNSETTAYSWGSPNGKEIRSEEDIGKSQTLPGLREVIELEDGDDELIEVPIGVRPRNYHHSCPSQKRERRSGVTLNKDRYYCTPCVSSLDKMTDDNGNCFVENFTVGHMDWGEAVFEGRLNVGGLDLNKLVSFAHKEFCVYPNDDMPSAGEGLNRTCIVTLKNVWPRNPVVNEKGEMNDVSEELIRFEKCLQKACNRFNGEFISYNKDTGIWIFKIQCFPG